MIAVSLCNHRVLVLSTRILIYAPVYSSILIYTHLYHLYSCILIYTHLYHLYSCIVDEAVGGGGCLIDDADSEDICRSVDTPVPQSTRQLTTHPNKLSHLPTSPVTSLRTPNMYFR